MNARRLLIAETLDALRHEIGATLASAPSV